jgi:hypothetical protein
MGPGQAISRSSTERTDPTSAAVPQVNISSAMYRSVRARSVTTSGIPRSARIVRTDAWVRPSRAPADIGGVYTVPLRTTKMFSPAHSLTRPCGLRMMVPSYPARMASVWANDELT